MKMYIFVVFFVSLLSVEESIQFEFDIYKTKILEYSRTTESFEHSYATEVILDEDGDNKEKIELTDRYPSALWDIKKGKGNTIVIKADEGYKIAVAIIECSLDGKSSQVRISTDENLKSDDTLLFAYEVKEHFSYLFNSNILYVQIDAGRTINNFTANFTRFGEKSVTTTTSIPTTTIILPTPTKNDSSEITVFLEGIKSIEFKKEKVFNSLKGMILGMAKEYCEEQLFPLAGNITIHNIIISRLSACPKNWHNAEECIELKFSVPVELEEDASSKWTGYQMNSEHLRIMWERYSSKYLKGLWSYVSPNLDKSMTWEISISIVVILCFTVGLVVLRYVLVVRPQNKRQRKLSDAVSIVSSTSRISEFSLAPHYLQETPPLFDTTYTMYDPTVDDTFSKEFEFADFKTDVENFNKSPTIKRNDIEESGA